VKSLRRSGICRSHSVTCNNTESAWLADLQWTVYPHNWLPISCRSSAGQRKFAGQRPTFYHCTTQPSTKGGCYTIKSFCLQKLSTDFIETWCYDWPTHWKNWLTIGGDPVLDTDSRSLFHFHHHCIYERGF